MHGGALVTHAAIGDPVCYASLLFLEVRFVGCFFLAPEFGLQGFQIFWRKEIASNSVQGLVFVLLVEMSVSCVLPILNNLFLSSKKLISLLESL